MKSLVSIIMPLYNCEAFVVDSIKSVQEQTYTNWELIIVDDRSTDESYQIAYKYAEEDERIRLFQSEKNGGAAAARNYAIKMASGSYIAFLDSDDIWFPNKLENQLNFMQKNDSALSFTSYQYIDEQGRSGKYIVPVPTSITYHDLLKRTAIACLTVVYDVSKIGKHYFDTTLELHEDYHYWLEILKLIDHADGISKPLAFYRVRNNSLSSNKVLAAYHVWKIQKEYQGISFLKRVYYFSSYIFYALIKHLRK